MSVKDVGSALQGHNEWAVESEDMKFPFLSPATEKRNM